MRKRYAQVGLGGRSMMFSRALVEDFADHGEDIGYPDYPPMPSREEPLPYKG